MAQRTYATVNLYSPWGGLEREQFGTDTPLYHKQHYTNRGQLYDMRLSTVNDGAIGTEAQSLITTRLQTLASATLEPTLTAMSTFNRTGFLITIK